MGLIASRVFEPTSEDKSNDIHWKKHAFASDEEITRQNLSAHSDRFTLFRGWIPDRFGEVSHKTFAIVHVDVDQYQPTKDPLEFFWSPLARRTCDLR